jgi:hypothetical protein
MLQILGNSEGIPATLYKSAYKISNISILLLFRPAFQVLTQRQCSYNVLIALSHRPARSAAELRWNYGGITVPRAIYPNY